MHAGYICALQSSSLDKWQPSDPVQNPMLEVTYSTQSLSLNFDYKILVAHSHATIPTYVIYIMRTTQRQSTTTCIPQYWRSLTVDSAQSRQVGKLTQCNSKETKDLDNGSWHNLLHLTVPLLHQFLPIKQKDTTAVNNWCYLWREEKSERDERDKGEGKRVSEIISIVGQYYSSSIHECVVHNAIQCSATG